MSFDGILGRFRGNFWEIFWVEFWGEFGGGFQGFLAPPGGADADVHHGALRAVQPLQSHRNFLCKNAPKMTQNAPKSTPKSTRKTKKVKS